MSKIKLRCNTCKKWFQATNAKEHICPDCIQKARQEKKAAQTSSPPSNPTMPQRVNPPPPVPQPKPKSATSGSSHWLDTISDVKVGQPDQPVRPKISSTPAIRTNPRRAEPRELRGTRSPLDYRKTIQSTNNTSASLSGVTRERPRLPMEEPAGYRATRSTNTYGTRSEKPYADGNKESNPRGQKPKTGKPAAPPKPQREKIPSPSPFVPTPEQIMQIEARYRELVAPSEFDGIRAQIAQESGIPKKAVKQIVKDLREREHIPSWWDIQPYHGSSEDLERIKEAYTPFLPVPPLSIHQKIAAEFSLKPEHVYQAIKVIRQEMQLPQYNDPTLHDQEPVSTKKVQDT